MIFNVKKKTIEEIIVLFFDSPLIEAFCVTLRIF